MFPLLLCLQVSPLVYLENVPFIIVFTGTATRIFRDRSLYYCVLQVRPLVYLEIVPFIIVFTGTATRIFRECSLYYCVYR